MRNAMLMLAVVMTAAAARAVDPPRLIYGKRTQAVGQSDYEFAKACVSAGTNGKTLGDREWEREQDRLDAAYEADLGRVFDWVAGQRATPFAAFDLKTAFQEEQLEHWEEYVEKMKFEADLRADSDSPVDKVLKASYTAAARKGQLKVDACKRKLATLEADRRNAEKKR